MKRILTNNKWLWMLLIGIPTLLISCFDEVHDDELGGLAINIDWQDDEDAQTEVKNLHLWIYNASTGKLEKELTYTDARTLADERHNLAKGKYRVVIGVNMSDQVLADVETLDNVNFFINGAAVPEQQMFYGTVDAELDGTSVCQVTDVLRRLFAELSVTITNVPSGAVLNGEVLSTAECFYPSQKGTDGEYGVESSGAKTLRLPEDLTPVNGTIETGTIYLMPTASSLENSHAKLVLKTSDGKEQIIETQAPVMVSNGKYQINLDYHTMRPYIDITGNTINKWEDGWSYDGESPLPNE